jgi:hypothetical protein
MIMNCPWGVPGFDNTVVVGQTNADFQNSLTGGVPLNQQYQLRRKLSTIDIYGGNPEVTNWQARIPTFEDNPVPVKFTYLAIYNLIADPTKKANLLRATNEYFAAWQAAMAAAQAQLAAQAQAEFNLAKTIILNFVANFNLWQGMPHAPATEIDFPFLSIAAGQSVHPPDLGGNCVSESYESNAPTANMTQVMSASQVTNLGDVGSCSWQCHACVHCERNAIGQLRIFNDPARGGNLPCSGQAIVGPWVSTGCSGVKFTSGALWDVAECCFICPSA